MLRSAWMNWEEARRRQVIAGAAALLAHIIMLALILILPRHALPRGVAVPAVQVTLIETPQRDTAQETPEEPVDDPVEEPEPDTPEPETPEPETAEAESPVPETPEPVPSDPEPQILEDTRDLPDTSQSRATPPAAPAPAAASPVINRRAEDERQPGETHEAYLIRRWTAMRDDAPLPQGAFNGDLRMVLRDAYCMTSSATTRALGDCPEGAHPDGLPMLQYAGDHHNMAALQAAFGLDLTPEQIRELFAREGLRPLDLTGQDALPVGSPAYLSPSDEMGGRLPTLDPDPAFGD
ncbi:hypothetical protein RMQ97_10920 [Maricaulis sp. D1M11]|uniref:hypothetical protein n=1 Tax=Maricaulis sp. D1M11 TaxID=3076117 RepID=UPI0039B45BD9